MNCPKCNSENEPNAKFCRSCGSPMQECESENKASVKSAFYLALMWIIILIGIGGIITGVVCYSTYRDMPDYLLISALGLFFMLLCVPINKKRRK